MRLLPEPPLWLPLAVVERYMPLARELGVADSARGRRCFVQAYHKAEGDSLRLPAHWRDRRNALVTRGLAEVLSKGVPLFVGGLPSRQHLALIMWASSPRPASLSA